MFKFEAEQKVYDIGGVQVGGQPGEWPTVLIASIFYQGDRNVIDEMAGEFNREAARACIDELVRVAQMTGTPVILDLVAASERAMVNYIDFVVEETELPFVIDGTVERVRLAGARHVVEHGVQARAIYDSIGTTTREHELAALRELALPTTLVLVLDNRKPTVAGRVRIAPKLIDLALSAGFRQLLLDTAVLDVVEPGPAGKAIFELKQRFGYPSGCSPTHTHRHRWKKRRGFGDLGERTAKTSTATSMQILGADFIMYGIKQTEIVPAMGMVDALIAFTAMQNGVQPKDDRHPLYTMFAT
ncbi:MAG: hypothetical protein M5U01_22745 [Ardenticatenaceae bacterium]|nr:hypothetical protein [Ardenticatenaceae bacterium]